MWRVPLAAWAVRDLTWAMAAARTETPNPTCCDAGMGRCPSVHASAGLQCGPSLLSTALLVQLRACLSRAQAALTACLAHWLGGLVAWPGSATSHWGTPRPASTMEPHCASPVPHTHPKRWPPASCLLSGSPRPPWPTAARPLPFTAAPAEGQVAIFDATNTTDERRRLLIQHLHGKVQYMFIESICNDNEVRTWQCCWGPGGGGRAAGRDAAHC